jgi:hypothetical protein
MLAALCYDIPESNLLELSLARLLASALSLSLSQVS